MSVLRGGLLVEGTRTNLALRSQEFDNAYWTKIRSTISATPVVGVDGNLSNATLVENDQTGGHFITRTFNALAAGTYTYSVFARPRGRTRLNIFWNGGGFTGSRFFDLATGTVGGTSGSTPLAARITPAAFGYYRCEIAVTTTTTGDCALDYLLVNDANSFSYTGIAGLEAMDFWGAQLEVGPFASSYIPTVAATVTRATDQVSYANFPQPAEIAARGGITIYNRFVDQGARDTASCLLWRVGLGVLSNNKVHLEFVRLSNSFTPVFRTGDNSASAPSQIGLPGFNSLVEALSSLEYRLNGGVPEFRTLYTEVRNGGVPIVATPGEFRSAVTAIANGWQTSPTLHIGARDGGNNASFALHQQLKAAYGVQTIDYMRGLI